MHARKCEVGIEVAYNLKSTFWYASARVLNSLDKPFYPQNGSWTNTARAEASGSKISKRKVTERCANTIGRLFR